MTPTARSVPASTPAWSSGRRMSGYDLQPIAIMTIPAATAKRPRVSVYLNRGTAVDHVCHI